MKQELIMILSALIIFSPAFAWRDDYTNWSYFEELNVISNDINQTDYHTTLIIDTQTLIGEGKLQDDGDDFRFYFENYSYDFNGDFEGDTVGNDPEDWEITTVSP